jgi:hypothetical protein
MPSSLGRVPVRVEGQTDTPINHHYLGEIPTSRSNHPPQFQLVFVIATKNTGPFSPVFSHSACCTCFYSIQNENHSSQLDETRHE